MAYEHQFIIDEGAVIKSHGRFSVGATSVTRGFLLTACL